MFWKTRIVNAMHVLDTVEPGLTEKLKSLSLEKQRQLFGIVAEVASRFVQDIEPELAQIVSACSQGKELEKSQIEAVRLSAKWADERYFDLKLRGVDESVWLNWFGKARLATALSSASSGSSWNSFADALYELSAIFHSTSDFASTISQGIEAVRRTA
jgi:hypothetical protein